MTKKQMSGTLGMAIAVVGFAASAFAAPTDGWHTQGASWSIEKPWNVSQSARYANSGGIEYFWVYSTDQPAWQGSPTGPRTEARWWNDYCANGCNRMFDSDVYVVSGTNGACVMQIFGATGRSTATMVQGTGGCFSLYGSQAISCGVNNTWKNLKVAHFTGSGTINYFVNNTFVYSNKDHGDGNHFFKHGVYAQPGMSSKMEARFRNTKQWVK